MRTRRGASAKRVKAGGRSTARRSSAHGRSRGIRAVLAAAAGRAAAGRGPGLAAFICIIEVTGAKVRLVCEGRERFSRQVRSSPGKAAFRGATATARGLLRGVTWSRVAEGFFAAGGAHRLKILAHLLEGAGSYRSLQRLTHLQAGPLYHHIDRLRLAGLAKVERRDRYVLTPAGRNLVLVALAAAGVMKGR